MRRPPNLEVRGFRLHYCGKVTPEAREKIVEWVERMEDGRLVRWSTSWRGDGSAEYAGVWISFPAEWDELQVLQWAQLHYSRRKGGTVSVERKGPPRRGCFRHPDLPGAIDVLYAPPRQESLPL